ncbi:hypothetical protein VPDG_00126 [Vibrio phage henriette 12B8]|uniref:hypothetical protein n=1 Tax=Vibrio phage henriette 12B8 TaxID=573174 RepID=UPI0002C13A1E|nr:hypothetical protein VPDG_00126 [Vibrio phage henriette 12B8]AGG58287.1 hypothetical protein VPDG_00126 [Vibrio phage henriette 12B8]
MAIVPLPSGLIFSNLTVTHNIPNFKTESINMKQKTKGRGLHRMEGTIDVTIGGLQEQKAWTSFLLKVRGSLNEFQLDLPLHFKTDITSNPTISYSIPVGTTRLMVGAFDGSIPEGSCFTMPNDTKLYHVTSNVNGGITFDVFPAIRQSQLTNSVMEFKDPLITVRFSDDPQSITYSENGLILEATLDWVEAL